MLFYEGQPVRAEGRHVLRVHPEVSLPQAVVVKSLVKSSPITTAGNINEYFDPGISDIST